LAEVIPRVIYCAYPIDRADQPTVAVLFNALRHLRDLLGHQPVVMYEPGQAFTVGKDCVVGGEINAINDAALNLADAMVVILPSGSRTWGVPAEVDRAVQAGIPVAIVSDAQQSWAQWPRGNTAWFVPDDRGWPGAVWEAVEWLMDQPTYDPQDGTSEGLEVATPYEKASETVQAAEDITGVLFQSPLGVAQAGVERYGELPTRAYPDDAGLDLYVVGDHHLQPGEFKDIPSGIAVELPSWSWGMLVGRSSTLRKRDLLVNTGIIDCGYRGELYAGVKNIGSQVAVIQHGDRIAQLIVMENSTRRVDPVEVVYLGAHARGHKGFGSSGV
jgi:dUTP pyrophosphatase